LDACWEQGQEQEREQERAQRQQVPGLGQELEFASALVAAEAGTGDPANMAGSFGR